MIIGIIEQYEDKTYSLTSVDFSEEDQEALQAILDKYETDGYSVRGSIDELQLTDIL